MIATNQTDGDPPADDRPVASAVIVPSSPELNELAERVFADLQASVGFDRGAFLRVASLSEVAVVAVVSTGASRPPVGTNIPLSEILGGAATRVGLVVEVDLHNAQLPLDRLLASQGFRHVLRVPVGTAPLAAAGIAVVRRHEAFTYDDIQITQRIADAAGPAVLALVPGTSRYAAITEQGPS